MKKLVVLTGAGMSAESGLKTFRDAGGLWEGYKVEEVATSEAWNKNPTLVNQFYNERRRQLLQVSPNNAHLLLAKMQDKYDVQIITQNVDDLHERAGSKNVLHLHGELFKVRSCGDARLIYDWKTDLNSDDIADDGFPLRPHIVWFGEAVPMIERAISIISTADIVIIIGTSMQVYPAASLIHYAPKFAEKIYIDKNPNENVPNDIRVISKTAVEGVQEIYNTL